jgi:hypothetical protein
VTLIGETATGWQTATLSTPLTLTAGQTNVVSYYAPNGRYSATAAYFKAPRSAWIHRSANAVAGFLTQAGCGVRALTLCDGGGCGM